MNETEDDEPIKIPKMDWFLGSCPDCGRTVWYSYLVRYIDVTVGQIAIFRCIECKREVSAFELIPF